MLDALTALTNPTAGLQPQRNDAARNDSAAARSLPQDDVTVSPAAESLSRVSVKELPELVLDLKTLMQQAEQGLERLMKQLGIERSAGLTVRSHNDGTFSVEGEHPKAAALEAAISEDFETRNALIGAHTAATLNRIGEAMSRAMQAADANPAQADNYYARVANVARETSSMDFRFGFGADGFAGAFVASDGRQIAVAEGLTLPG